MLSFISGHVKFPFFLLFPNFSPEIYFAALRQENNLKSDNEKHCYICYSDH
ncbi:MAG: hypothetical protein PWR04_824 [Anaerophaga sp.]|nr:hypothetical protein [Anaerophaga sp.]